MLRSSSSLCTNVASASADETALGHRPGVPFRLQSEDGAAGRLPAAHGSGGQVTTCAAIVTSRRRHDHLRVVADTATRDES